VFRTAPGPTFHALLHAADAAFEIDGIDERSRTGWSVIIRGITDEVTNPSNIDHLDRLGLETRVRRNARAALSSWCPRRSEAEAWSRADGSRRSG
jgi:hypothetical protein